MPLLELSTAVEDILPQRLRSIENPQTALPAIAKDRELMAEIEEALGRLPTHHTLYAGDARTLPIPPESVHLVVTSPPYWTLKEYNETEGQLGHIADYRAFLKELDLVWESCFQALVPGG